MVSDERAQLVLVGAIAIGIVIIGMTIVLNSAVFTENVADSNPVEVTGDVGEFDREATRSVRSIAVRVNHVGVHNPNGAGGHATLRGDLQNNVSNYSRAVGESYADTGSVYVNVTFDGVGENGTRLVQDEDDDFNGGPGVGGNPTWTLFDGPFQLGWFVMNLEVENVSDTDQFHVEIRNTSGATKNVSIWQTNTGDIAINSSPTGGTVPDATCAPTNGRVVVDAVTGTGYSDTCSFNGTDQLQQPYDRLRFVNADNAYGRMDVVANETSTGPGVVPCVAPHAVCESAAAWSVEFTTNYRTGEVSYERKHNMSVYDP